MKTLVVLAALTAVALAGPTYRDGDADLDITKEKRSPTFGSLQHHLPIHHHQPYVQPIIPHHLGLKKPLIVSHPYGHHYGHIFRSEEDQLEMHSSEAKESKKTCMKEMEAKCNDEISARSSEVEEATKVEDIDGSVSDSEVAQSLKMAKEAVDTLQKKLQLAEKNPRMTQWKHGESEADDNMHENIETAKLALEHMQRNFGNLESMNVHARAFKNSEVHDANLKIEPAFKSSKDLKTDEERLAQWKDAIETIQKNVELVRDIEDSFQNKALSEKSATLEKSSSLQHQISDDLKEGAIELKKEKSSDSQISDMKTVQDLEKKSHDIKFISQVRENEKSQAEDMKMAQNMEKKSTAEKSSWQARKHEKSLDSKNEMETSASTLSESKTTLHHTNDQVFRSESSQSEKNTHLLSVPTEKSMDIKSSISQTSQLKSNEEGDMKQAKQAHIEIEMDSPLVDTTTFMKSAEHNKAEQHKQIEQFSSNGHSLHKEHEMNTHDHQRMAAERHQSGHSSHMGHSQQGEHLSQMGQSTMSQQGGHSSLMGHSQQGEHSSQMGQSTMSQQGGHSSLMGHSQQAGHSSHMGHSQQGEHSSQMGQSTMSQQGGHSSLMGHSQQGEHSSQRGQSMMTQHGHQKFSNSAMHPKEAQEISLDQSKERLLDQHKSLISTMNGKEAHEMTMKSSDQLTGQSQLSGVIAKPAEFAASGHHSEKLHSSLSHGAHGKSAEDAALFAPIGMNSDFKEALVPKAWKEGQARGAYGSGIAGLSGYGSGYGSGSGAVGVFPSARVGGCAIPLLLSCSPNVVAGHLAKGHSYGAAAGYGASAYRSDNLNSHSKRDITKISRPTKINRTPTNRDLQQKLFSFPISFKNGKERLEPLL
ncbi:histone acetyltransferase KAT6A-like [Leguminivora glycinivorella]|uniref:histone acetyltransferase KAT6A-like n=1 Tax=Leguminivora glycinivorella TaxID=1035111 RepID=UPI00200FE4B4|nr:histone acetyltransferase KAT6A-like [Leguminivora glycinivorella]